MSDDETIFDKIIKKEIPADIVYEDDDVLAFNDISPQAPIHVLIIPKKKSKTFTELKEKDYNEVGVLFSKCAKIAELKGLDKDGYRIVVNAGKFGQQTVDYLHVHLLGGRQLNWPPG